MYIATDNLVQAYCDIVFLLDRNYPKKSVVTFVSNHYNLDKIIRNILIRAALSQEEVYMIKENLIESILNIKEQEIHVDVYNQLITFFSIINKDPLFICRDGVLRDIFSSIHSFKDLKIEKDLILSFLNSLSELQSKKLLLYFDSQKSHSKKHANVFDACLKLLNINGQCIISQGVDKKLKNIESGILISHDSIIIQKVHFFDFSLWFCNKSLSKDLQKRIIVDFSKVNCKCS